MLLTIINFLSCSFSGHRNAATIIELSEEDIRNIEKFSTSIPDILRSSSIFKNSKSANKCANQLSELIFGNYLLEKEKFMFPPGHMKLLLAIANDVQSNVYKSSVNGARTIDFSFFDAHEDYERCPIMITPIGALFSDISGDGRSEVPSKAMSLVCTNNTEMEQSFVRQSEIGEKMIKKLVNHLHSALFSRLEDQMLEMISQDVCVNKLEDLKSETVEVNSKSVNSMLQASGIIPKSNQPNDAKKCISAIIHCFCAKTKRIRVFFRCKDSTRDIFMKVLVEEDTSDNLDKEIILAHMASCWSMSNFHSHRNKMHVKRTNLDESKNYIHIYRYNMNSISNMY